MNQFQYTLAIEKIDKLKTLKTKEELARELYTELEPLTYKYGGGLTKEADKDSAIFLYKSLSKLIPLYTGTKGLPQFITSKVESVKNYLARDINNPDNNYTYEQFLDMFEFDTVVDLGAYTPTDFATTIKLIADNTPPFQIEYSFYSSNRFSYLLDEIQSDAYKARYAIELEEFKRSLPADIKYTMVERSLAGYYKEMSSNVNLDQPEFLSKLDNIIANLATSAATMRSKMNG